MKKITYLLGAGASAEAIPVVNGMHNRLLEITNLLENIKRQMVRQEGDWPRFEDIGGNLTSIIKDFKWAINEISGHPTFDTLAKKYFLTNNTPELNKLKVVLILYFSFVQLVDFTLIANENERGKDEPPFIPRNKYFDKRYDGFIASIARNEEDGFNLSKNILILSWNYDMQFEFALRNYKKKQVQKNQREFNIIPNMHSIQSKHTILEKNDESFLLIKLNGNAFWAMVDPKQPGKLLDYNPWDFDIRNKNKKELIQFNFNTIIKNYNYLLEKNGILNQIDPIMYLNFAWENSPNFINKYPTYTNHLNLAVEKARETEILVIIGYSFPIFNRESDKKMVNSMVNLKKVYIQDYNAKQIESILINSLGLSAKKEINFQLEEKNLGQFMIPFELDFNN